MNSTSKIFQGCLRIGPETGDASCAACSRQWLIFTCGLSKPTENGQQFSMMLAASKILAVLVLFRATTLFSWQSRTDAALNRTQQRHGKTQNGFPGLGREVGTTPKCAWLQSQDMRAVLEKSQEGYRRGALQGNGWCMIDVILRYGVDILLTYLRRRSLQNLALWSFMQVVSEW